MKPLRRSDYNYSCYSLFDLPFSHYLLFVPFVYSSYSRSNVRLLEIILPFEDIWLQASQGGI